MLSLIKGLEMTINIKGTMSGKPIKLLMYDPEALYRESTGINP